LIYGSKGRRVGPQVDNLSAKRLKADRQAPQAGLVQLSNQHSVGAVLFDTEISERLTASLIQTTTDGDPAAVNAHLASWARVTSADTIALRTS
jgi:hypothetical protein